MAVFTTEGIIVKRSNFGEADRILTLITPFKGKIKTLAKGVRKITSRRGGSIELLNKVRAQIFQGKGMELLTEVESLETFPKLKSNLVLSTYASHIIELSERLLPEGQSNPQAYNLLATVLELLEASPRQVFIRAFEVKFLSVLGFWSMDGIEGRKEVKEVLEKLQKGSWEEIAQINLDKESALEVERILRYYIEKVLESPLRSMKVIEGLKGKD